MHPICNFQTNETIPKGGRSFEFTIEKEGNLKFRHQIEEDFLILSYLLKVREFICMIFP